MEKSRTNTNDSLYSSLRNQKLIWLGFELVCGKSGVSRGSFRWRKTIAKKSNFHRTST